MPAPVTFTVSNAAVSHQVTLELDLGHTHSKTIKAIIDGVEHHLDDCRARRDGKALQGGGVTIMVAQTTITVLHTGHVTFSGIIPEDVSRRIIRFIVDCGLPRI